MNLSFVTFPHAGGSAAFFNSWKEHFPSSVSIHSVEYPGRGTRICDQLEGSRNKLVQDIFCGLDLSDMNHSIVLCGYSLGALIAFEVAQLIDLHFPNRLLKLIVCSSSAPHMRIGRKQLHSLNDEEFKTEIQKLGGTPDELWVSRELTNLYLPILKNDLMLAETELPNYIENPVSSDIFGIFGMNDKLSSVEKSAWSDCTEGSFNFSNIDGGHFFVNGQESEVVDLILKHI